MVQYAFFLNRTTTHQFFPYFKIIYFTEFITILSNFLLSPIMAWITWNAQPLHRNIRYSIIHCILHIFLVNLSRIPLLWAQQFADDWEEYSGLLTVCSFIRFESYAFQPWIILAVTIERLVATHYWSWYEKQESNTLLVITVIVSIFECFAIVISYHILYQDVIYQAETVKALKMYSIIFAAILITVGFVGYFLLLYYNHLELRKLRRRADPNFDKYSLARTYQLRENVVIMKMMVKIVAPAFIFASPVFIFRGVAYLLSDNPRYEVLSNICTALFDLWVALTCLHVQVIFPFFDYRFRQPAARISIFRRIMEMRRMENSSGRFVRKHLSVSPIQTSDYYFQWLGKDLNREGHKTSETNRQFVVIV